MVFLGQAGDAGREAGTDDILTVSPSVPRWTGVACRGPGFVAACSAGHGGARLEGLEDVGEVGRSFVFTQRRGVEVCRALRPAHTSEKHLDETMGPRLRPHRRRQRLHLESTSRPMAGLARPPSSPRPQLLLLCLHEPHEQEGAYPCGAL